MHIFSILHLARPLQNSLIMEDSTNKNGSQVEGENGMSKKKHQHDRPQALPESQNLQDMCRKADQLFFQKLFHNHLGDDAPPYRKKLYIMLCPKEFWIVHTSPPIGCHA